MRKNIKYLLVMSACSATLAFTACSKDDSSTLATTSPIPLTISPTTSSEQTTESITEEPTTNYDNDGTRPNVVNFYVFQESTGTRDKLSEFYGPFNEGQDIRTFASFSSDKASVSGSRFADMWIPEWQQFSNSSECKIGYKIHIYLKDGSAVERRILSPTDIVPEYTEYVETWIYDDVHRAAGEWYSHLTEADMNDDTIISSVKLTCGSKISEVDYVVLDTFIYYNDTQFDANGDYIGPIKASVKVCQDTTEHIN